MYSRVDKRNSLPKYINYERSGIPDYVYYNVKNVICNIQLFQTIKYIYI